MISHIALLFAAVIAGGINAVAGGGSFISFPALLGIGLPALQANATNAIALWPASIASSGAYYQEIVQQRRGFLILMMGTSLIGGSIGAQLLLHTPASIFQNLIPYLLLTATLLFLLSGPITARFRARPSERKRSLPTSLVIIGLTQLLIATYGGYFGAGIGILMLTLLRFMGIKDIHAINGLKTLQVACISGIAVLLFILANDIFWPDALVMMVGAVIGGYGGAYYARKIDPRLIRGFVIIAGMTMTIYSFIK